MFRTMRRFKQQISKEECIRILQEEKRGIVLILLAVILLNRKQAAP